MMVNGVFLGSGWKGGGIYIATGLVSETDLTVGGVRLCDGIMELAAAIVDSR